jgi:transposase
VGFEPIESGEADFCLRRLWSVRYVCGHGANGRVIRDRRFTVFAFPRAARGFERRLTPVRRQHHVVGEKAFVNYLGKWIGIVDPSTREIREAEIFVGVLGASNLTYAEAT